MQLNERFLTRLLLEEFIDKFAGDSTSLVHLHDPAYDGYFPYHCRALFGFELVVFTTELIPTVCTLKNVDLKLIAGGFAYGSNSSLKVPEIIIIDERALMFGDLFL